MGLALVCSTIIRKGFSVWTKPYSLSSAKADSNVNLPNSVRSTKKFTYPSPAASTDFTSGNPERLTFSTICSAIFNGFLFASFASSKETEDDNSPNSAAGGDSNANETSSSGKSLSKVPLRTVSQATRNSANGLTEVITCQLLAEQHSTTITKLPNQKEKETKYITVSQVAGPRGFDPQSPAPQASVLILTRLRALLLNTTFMKGG